LGKFYGSVQRLRKIITIVTVLQIDGEIFVVAVVVVVLVIFVFAVCGLRLTVSF